MTHIARPPKDLGEVSIDLRGDDLIYVDGGMTVYLLNDTALIGTGMDFVARTTLAARLHAVADYLGGAS